MGNSCGLDSCQVHKIAEEGDANRNRNKHINMDKKLIVSIASTSHHSPIKDISSQSIHDKAIHDTSVNQGIHQVLKHHESDTSMQASNNEDLYNDTSQTVQMQIVHQSDHPLDDHSSVMVKVDEKPNLFRPGTHSAWEASDNSDLEDEMKQELQ